MNPEIQDSSKQTEVPVPTAPTRHPLHKTPILLAFLFIFFVAAAFFVGIYYQGMNKKTEVAQISPTPQQPTPTLDPTADWKTYTNNGISLKYPSNWNISPDTSNTLISSNSPKIRLVVAAKDGTLMNECMQEISNETKNGLTMRKFSRETTGAMCSTADSSPREILVFPSKDDYSPGISYQYSATESKQAEEIFNQILSTFTFTD